MAAVASCAMTKAQSMRKLPSCARRRQRGSGRGVHASGVRKAHHAASLQRHAKDHDPAQMKLGYKRSLKPPVAKGVKVNREQDEAFLNMVRI